MRKIKVNFGGTYGFREAELLLCPHTPSLLFLKSKKLLFIPHGSGASLIPPYAKGRGRRGNRRFPYPYSCAGIFEILLSSFGHETLASLNSKHVPVWSLY